MAILLDDSNQTLIKNSPYYKEIDKQLTLAQQALESPIRGSFIDRKGKLTNNLSIMLSALQNAVKHDDTNLDLLANLASAYIFNNKIEQGINLYRTILYSEPHNTNILFRYGYWCHYAGRNTEYNVALHRLKKLSSDKANLLYALPKTLTRCISRPITNTVPSYTKNIDALIVLGFKLNSDGSVPSMLKERLTLCRHIAIQFPLAKIIVTGGVQQNGITEAEAMAEWLIGSGIEKARILIEPYAKNTIENIQLSVKLLTHHHLHNNLIITSACHGHRAHALFTSYSLNQHLNNHTFMPVTVINPATDTYDSPTRNQKLSIYLDCLRVCQFNAFSYRQLQYM
ncbi:YdcF family protein [Vibrio sp. Of7-15]|uniref:YdcF family protein n=1 Tax=Vibrio sp. Of7-15 TaxID=2724879 RepID=UPI001EF2E99A|nr:YdcF family protein [Vibrio sp. Of7-15]MCG7495533.1 YdcF family protein [Vibrio sp. Of7-15]